MVLNSRYSLILATSKRARQLIGGAKPLADSVKGKKPLSIAIDELYHGKVKILPGQHEEEVFKRDRRSCTGAAGRGSSCRRSNSRDLFPRRVQNNMKLLFISLGCDKEPGETFLRKCLECWQQTGQQIVDDEDEAERDYRRYLLLHLEMPRKRVSIPFLSMAEKKKAGTCKVLIVTGCMAQRYKEEISEEIPEVDANPWNYFLRRYYQSC